MKCHGKLEEKFPKRAWGDKVGFLSKMKLTQIIVKPMHGEEGAIVWDVPEPCQQLVGPNGRWCQECASYDAQISQFIERSKRRNEE
jgi:hypothetical protein